MADIRPTTASRRFTSQTTISDPDAPTTQPARCMVEDIDMTSDAVSRLVTSIGNLHESLFGATPKACSTADVGAPRPGAVSDVSAACAIMRERISEAQYMVLEMRKELLGDRYIIG